MKYCCLEFVRKQCYLLLIPINVQMYLNLFLLRYFWDI